MKNIFLFFSEENDAEENILDKLKEKNHRKTQQKHK